MKRILLLLLALCLAQPGTGRVRLPSLIGSGMVLQRDCEARIWGWAAPDARIKLTASWDTQTHNVRADGEGRWDVRLRTPGAGGPYTLTIDDGERVTLDDILIGEVWLCSGQSNMEMPLKGFDSQPVHGGLDAAMRAGGYPGIRLFQVARATASEPQQDCTGKWEISSMRPASGFSAVGYYFGLWLHRALGIPVGLIESDWGATRIEAWMSAGAAQSVDEKILATDAAYDAQNRVAALYNAMIRPLTPYTLRGFIWYQGESNKGYHAKYPYDMAALAANWRAAWGGGEQMPFYYVQLAPFDYDIPIHPPRKDLVGQRLALLALTGTYGCEGIDSRGPLFERADFGDGRAVVTFRSNSTLIPTDTPLQGFEIAGKDRIFHPAEAFVIHRDYDFSRQVEVRSDAVAEPVAVRYAFRNVVERVNLTNTIGLPAFPFRTDTWDDAGFTQ